VVKESHDRFVDEGAALAVLDLDDPKIEIEFAYPDTGCRSLFRDASRTLNFLGEPGISNITVRLRLFQICVSLDLKVRPHEHADP